MIVLGMLVWLLYKIPDSMPVRQYMFITITIIMIILQFYVFGSNWYSKREFVKNINEEYHTNYTVSNIPLNVVADNIVPRNQAVKIYLETIGFIIYYPLFISVLSFVVWFYGISGVKNDMQGKDKERESMPK